MQNTETILEGYSDLEKGAYLGAIASLATADKEASEEELEYISQLADSASLSEEQKTVVLNAATEISGDELSSCLEILKKSELKYSLVADLMAFAKSDQNYSEEEQQSVHKIAQALNLDQQQFALLDQFAEKTSAQEIPTDQKEQSGFLSSLGLKEKLEKAGINPGNLMKGLIGIAGPMILAGIMRGGFGKRGGSGGMFNSGGMLGGGGLGSLIGMLSGGRGLGSAGGLLGRVLGGRF